MSLANGVERESEANKDPAAVKERKDWFEKQAEIAPEGVRMHKCELRAGDIVVCGAMKTGTTWLQQILHQIRIPGDEDYSDIYSVSPWIPFPFAKWDFDFDSPQRGAPPRIFKTHDYYEDAIKTEGVKWVVICRNPLDTLWSYAQYIDRWLEGALKAELFLQVMKQRLEKGHPLNRIGNVFGHIASWWPHHNDPNVLWVHYEDLQADLGQCVRKIARFVGRSLTEKEERLICEMSSFEYMASNKQRFMGSNVVEVIAKCSGTQPWRPNIGMVRDDGGKVGEGEQKMSNSLKDFYHNLWRELIADRFGFEGYQQLHQHASLLKCDKI